MIYEMRGLRLATQKMIRVRVSAPSREEAIAQAVANGVVVDAGSVRVESSEASPQQTNPQQTNPQQANPQQARPPLPESPAPRVDAGAGHGGVFGSFGKWAMIAGIGAVVMLSAIIATVAATSSSSAPLQSADAAVPVPQPTGDARTGAPVPVRLLGAPAPERPLEPGYERSTSDRTQVRWTPGKPHPRYAHITSATREGYWDAAPGYRFMSPNSLVVTWTPNVPHPTAGNVVSSTRVGVWVPADGYRWVNAKTGDLSVMRAGPTEEQIKSALGKILIAAGMHAGTGPAETDGVLEAAGRELLREVRNEAIRSAIGDLFPGERQDAINAATNLIALGIDGQLTADNWVSETTRDALVDRLRRDGDVSSANALELADFVGRVVQAYQR